MKGGGYKLLLEKLLWTYDYIFFKEDGTTETIRVRYEDNDKALYMATLLMNVGRRVDVTECHVISVVRSSKMLIGMLEPAQFSYDETYFKPTEVYESMREIKLKGWTIKWEGDKEGFVNDYSFVLLDEEKDALLYISFEKDAFNIEKPRLYSHSLRIDPLNTTITIIDLEEEEYEEDED